MDFKKFLLPLALVGVGLYIFMPSTIIGYIAGGAAIVAGLMSLFGK